MATAADQHQLEFLPIPGIRLGVAAAEIRYRGRNDLLVIELAEGATCAAVFTRNAFCAAPVVLARRHLAEAATAFLLINSGNANAGTGDPGMRAAEESCRALAALRGCGPEQVLPFSTGVIGEPLPVNRLAAGLPAALTALSEMGWADAARAIMTTDTVPKLVSRRVEVNGNALTVTGMAKGSGMIKPDMATMLGYIATDAAVPKALLQACLEAAVDPSFNSITVDGDTSTNDACVLMATGRGEVRVTAQESAEFQALTTAVTEVAMILARMIIKDGEGATKLIEVRVEGARDREEARQVGYTIAHSPLVKTAIFAADPNWGRILAAVGRAGVEVLDIQAVRIWLDDVNIVRDGGRASDYTEQAGKRVMDQAEFMIRVALGRGDSHATILTCDFSYDYVRINAEYRS